MSQESRLRWPTPILFYAGETLQIVSAGLVSGFIFGNDAGPPSDASRLCSTIFWHYGRPTECAQRGTGEMRLEIDKPSLGISSRLWYNGIQILSARSNQNQNAVVMLPPTLSDSLQNSNHPTI